jgi:hypothetical protein
VCQVGREGDAGVAVAAEQLGQMMLVDGSLASLQREDLVFGVIHTDDGMAHLGKTDRGHETYVTRTHHGDLGGPAVGKHRFSNIGHEVWRPPA